MHMPRVFISAGELSGDIVGARLIAELRRRNPRVHVFGTGGRRMAEAGAEIQRDTSHIGVVGVTETFRTLPSVVSTFRAIHRRIAASRPDVAVLIGNDVFNVLLARWLRARGVPSVSFFPPQVWVWRSLARPIARSFDAIVASFPEEHEVYAGVRDGASVRFVGHYLADELAAVTASGRAAAREALGLPVDARVVGLLPGSRRDEVAHLTPVLLDTAARLAGRDPAIRFVMATAESTAPHAAVSSHEFGRRVASAADSHLVMKSADLILVASGTASLEAALLGTPMVIVYKVSPVTHLVVRAAIALGLIESYTVGLPNLVLRRSVVPEALQRRATSAVVADEAWTLLSDPRRLEQMRADLAAVADRLRGSQPIADAADAVLAMTPAPR